jgi:predicted glycoside hydrolase/deacetylase ChbG (UPF0249 family)
VTTAEAKYLIVNGDDFGASPGINRGIIEANRRGILTSASLLVDSLASAEAASLARSAPWLSVGLHVDLDRFSGDDVAACQTELQSQFATFEALVGRSPSHIDSHHNVHRDVRLTPHFVAFAHQHGLPLREHSGARYVSSFYGQWAGETHLEQINVQGLARILQAEVADGVTELGCHPGYVDAALSSSYTVEREAELRTLCDPAAARILSWLRITLVSFGDPRTVLTDPLTVVPGGPL